MSKLKLTNFDPSEYIETPADAVDCIQDALETENQAVIASAFGAVSKSMGMTLISQKTGLSREHLYRSFSENGNPTLKTMLAVLSALGVSLTAEKANKEQKMNEQARSYKELKEIVEKLSHHDGVKLCVHCAELLFEKCDIEDHDAPKIAIGLVKEWINNPTKENEDKCLEAATECEVYGDFIVDNKTPPIDDAYSDLAYCAAMAASNACRSTKHASNAVDVIGCGKFASQVRDEVVSWLEDAKHIMNQ
jgi:probable addiction module antidote protein